MSEIGTKETKTTDGGSAAQVPASDARERKTRDGGGAAIPSRDTGFAEGVVYALCAFLARIVLILLFDWRPRGTHRVPFRGPAILASNHASFLDPIVVGSSVSRRCCFLARETLFRGFLGWLMRNVGAFPIPRESVAPRKALAMTLRILEAGRILVLFPEGTRSPDGRLRDLKRGTAWIARRSGAPVVPVRVVGAWKAWPRTRRFPRPFPIRVFFGEPLRYDQTETVDAFLGRLREAMDELGRREEPGTAHTAADGDHPCGRPGAGSEPVASRFSINPAAGAGP